MFQLDEKTCCCGSYVVHMGFLRVAAPLGLRGYPTDTDAYPIPPIAPPMPHCAPAIGISVSTVRPQWQQPTIRPDYPPIIRAPFPQAKTAHIGAVNWWLVVGVLVMETESI